MYRCPRDTNNHLLTVVTTFVKKGQSYCVQDGGTWIQDHHQQVLDVAVDRDAMEVGGLAEVAAAADEISLPPSQNIGLMEPARS